MNNEHGHFGPFLITQIQGIEQTKTLHLTLKVLWLRQQSDAKIDFYLKVCIFQKICSQILTIFEVLDNPTKDPVHLELFCPFASEVLGTKYICT